MANNLSVKDVLKLKNLQSVSLTTSVSGAGGTCTAKVSTGVIKIKITTATDAKMATATIETPFSFEILDVAVQAYDVGAAGEWTAVLKNDTSAIATVSCATADLVKRPTTSFDTTYTTFAADDDDLVVTLSGSSLGTAVLALTILHT